MAARGTWEERAYAAAQRPGLWFALLALLLALQVKWWWQPCPDAVSYLSIARHLAHGELQRCDSPHVVMAPGYPLLVAPAFLISDRPFLIIAVVHFVLAMLLMAAVYLWFRRWGCPAAAPLAALVLSSACFCQHYRNTISELAFTTALMWAAYALERLIRAATWRQTALWGAAALCLSVLAASTRLVGVFLLVGFAATLLVCTIRRQIPWGRAAGLMALIGVPVGAAVLSLVVWDHAMAARAGEGAKSYAQHMAAEGMTPVEQVVEGTRLRISECGRLLLPGMYKAYARPGQWLNPVIPLYIALAGGLAWAWWKRIRDGGDLLLFMLPAYLGLYVIWPFDQGGRYLLPVLPILAFCLWGLLERLPQRRFVVLLALVMAHAGVSLGYWARDLRFARCYDQWDEVASLGERVRAEPSAVAWYDPEDRRQLEGLRLMLAYEVNRPLVNSADESAIGPDVRWLVVPSDCTGVAGFAARAAAGQLMLLERADSIAEFNSARRLPRSAGDCRRRR